MHYAREELGLFSGGCSPDLAALLSTGLSSVHDFLPGTGKLQLFISVTLLYMSNVGSYGACKCALQPAASGQGIHSCVAGPAHGWASSCVLDDSVHHSMAASPAAVVHHHPFVTRHDASRASLSPAIFHPLAPNPCIPQPSVLLLSIPSIQAPFLFQPTPHRKRGSAPSPPAIFSLNVCRP
jgi:hypothetical protein